MHARPRAALMLATIACASACDCRGDGSDASPAPTGRAGSLPSSVRHADPPARRGAIGPMPVALGDDRIALTFIEPVGDRAHRVRFTTLADGRWSEPVTVVESDRMFANWADFPAVVRTTSGDLLGHYAARSGEPTYAYDVALVRSSDDGASWSEIGRAHDDGTPTEHGFVSYVAEGRGARLFWLDGRATGDEGGATALRTALVVDGTPPTSEIVDPRVCDCCQTDAAVTDEGPVVVYRDRSEDEIRDIALVRRDPDGRWSAPIRVHADGWHTDGCPVNGPAVIADGSFVAVGWYTLGGDGGVRVAISEDGGRTFAPPVAIDGADAIGRVDLAGLDGEVAVSWMAKGADDTAEIRVARVSTAAAGEPLVVARTDASRAAGVPRMARSGGSIFLAYTEPGDDGARTRGALVAADDLGPARARPQTPAADARRETGPSVGEPMPDATFEDLRTGEAVSLASIDGPYVLAFFATWCEPCRDELPALTAIAAAHGDAVGVYSVSLDALPREEIRAFTDGQGIEHAVWTDSEHASARFGAPPLPSTFVVDSDGVVRFVSRSASDGEELAAAVAAVR